MSNFGIAFDEDLKRHDPGPGRPERPARLDAVGRALTATGLLESCRRIAVGPVDLALVTRMHAPAYVDRVAAACKAGAAIVDDADCGICPATFEAAKRSAGAVVEAARLIGRGEIRRAFCGVRPPGHHAEHDRARGFCFFANVVLAARVLRDEFGLERVAIVDWDVHHGNGTQHLLEDDPTVLFASLHGHPDTLYPGTGYAHETGIGAGAGFTLNVPFMPGAGDAEYRAAFAEQVAPRLDAFAPQAVIISAGFDAHAHDPLAQIQLSDAMYPEMTAALCELADRHAGGRVLSVLEGGYDLGVLERCVATHVQALEGGVTPTATGAP